jgi:hypothetical protein
LHLEVKSTLLKKIKKYLVIKKKYITFASNLELKRYGEGTKKFPYLFEKINLIIKKLIILWHVENR